MLSKVDAPARRGNTENLLTSAVESAWAYAAQGGSRVTLSSLRGSANPSAAAFQPGMPVGTLAFSRDGSTLAVAHEGDAVIKLFHIRDGATEELQTLELGAGSGRVEQMQMDEAGQNLVGIRAGAGWMDAIAWSAAANGPSVLARGTNLFAAIRPDGQQAAVYDPDSSTLQLFANGTGGFSLSSTLQLPAGSANGAKLLAALHFVDGRFVTIAIRDRAVWLCDESGECKNSILPIAAARAVRPLASPHVLFVESAKEGVPSYLLEFMDGKAAWHFVSRPADDRGGMRRTGIPVRGEPGMMR